MRSGDHPISDEILHDFCRITKPLAGYAGELRNWADEGYARLDFMRPQVSLVCDGLFEICNELEELFEEMLEHDVRRATKQLLVVASYLGEYANGSLTEMEPFVLEAMADSVRSSQLLLDDLKSDIIEESF